MSISTGRSAATSAGVFFRQLPEFDPDPALWGRIQTRGRRQRRWRRIRLGAFTGALASLVLVLAFVYPLASWQPTSAPELAVRQGTSQQLQEKLAAVSGAQDDFRALSELRLIDARLQAAYDRNATDDELAALWSLRKGALRALGADTGANLSVTRI